MSKPLILRLRDNLTRPRLGQGLAGAYSKRPKHTLEECAERLGTTRQRMGALMAKDPNHPRACLIAPATSYRGPRGYYDFQQVKAWFEAIQSSKEESTCP